MSICILFILFNGSGYLTPACYDGYELITPHNVAFVQHIPSEYDLYESPAYYLDYYWNAREEYCKPRYRGWSFWRPRAETQVLCGIPQYLQYVHYYRVPHRVRYNVGSRLKRNHHRHHYHYKNSYKKHRGHKKYKKYGKYGKRKNYHINYKKRSKNYYGTSYKKYKRPQQRRSGNVQRHTKPNRRQHHANRPKRKSRKR